VVWREVILFTNLNITTIEFENLQCYLFISNREDCGSNVEGPLNIITSTLKVVIGLVVFASLMMLEFNSYTRAVAEEVSEPIVLNSPKATVDSLAITDKKPSKLIR
jgi:hypothetical protein